MDLSTEISGIKIENPLMPASGPLVGDYEKIKFIDSTGVGAIVTKTISTKAANVPRPCIYGENNFVMNAELWSELPPETWIKEILPKLKNELKKPLIVSVGYTIEDMEILIPQLNEYADAFEISTHYVGKDYNTIANIVKAIRKNTNKPIFMKLSPHIPDPVEFTKTILENGANGIVAINSWGPTMKIDIKNRKTLIGNEKGQVWLSGPVIKPIALSIVKTIRDAFPDITIIGVGGIKSAEDVIEFLLSGADAVQLLSSALIFGKDIYEKILNQLPSTLEKYEFNSINEVLNTELTVGTVKYTPNYPKVNHEKCTLCGICEKVCPYFAIKIDKKVKINTYKCFGCGLCESRCPTKSIKIKY
ncbi:dihydroorotate dehydrogenase [Thermosipho melanesiensis]|uniref:dihydrouracil dehydrogenase (NAD(+)) n=2 Tax=Thermosipho melanesiensis TaxID=46541 RepID=A6LJ97_THEM4|nr:4Fe-4S binding protein [Thermosipho melanesiensis]ABR29998.1 dihydroorotate dehydrogenase family protein [Thermosipho melanesiensis BI429]APT73202.1 dihydroorotate dehydrogenase [Thermosipho melanesiensis]OOC38596.1 dihydroorotate dehydrogenase [Thermosipho melanesiensis]OOC40400.1 dihydroorotate dehydrogenase [Thermosipho melanesiensis]OOC40664.1 dihydroorotate dehydrogenase [Thermosipho melanesiensis]